MSDNLYYAFICIPSFLMGHCFHTWKFNGGSDTLGWIALGILIFEILWVGGHVLAGRR